jgi:alkanesulfonate monooxygenase SsuD/methylene tetrahydromethanopterin reductase-like flavin-dependent oxidoreductase (luciferase family)
VKLVLHLSHCNWSAEPAQYADVLTDVAALAEEGGLDGIAVADHLWQHPIMGGPEADLLEAYTTLAYLAARTRSVRLLTVVTGAHFRHPALLAKTVTSLDVLSGGRAWLGIGAGHYKEECTGLGVPFPPLASRYELLEDALQMCLRLWSGEHGDDGELHGHHVSATRLLQLPQALQRPHPPVLIAGTGPRRTLPLVARYGDACSLRPGPDIPATLDTLRRLCDETGRDFGGIERTCAFAFDPDDGGPRCEQLLGQLGWLAELGIDTVIGRVDGVDPRGAVERLARHVVPAATEIEPRPHTAEGT